MDTTTTETPAAITTDRVKGAVREIRGASVVRHRNGDISVEAGTMADAREAFRLVQAELKGTGWMYRKTRPYNGKRYAFHVHHAHNVTLGYYFLIVTP